MSEVPEAMADPAVDTAESGIPEGSGPAEDGGGTPAESSPAPDAQPAPEVEGAPPEAEASENVDPYKQRYGDLRTLHSQTTAELKAEKAEKERLRQENAALRQQQRPVDQEPYPQYQYPEQTPPGYQAPPPASGDANESVMRTLHLTNIARSWQDFERTHPDAAQPERRELIERKMLEVGWNPSNVMESDTLPGGRYDKARDNAYQLLFGNELTQKQQAEKKKQEAQRAAEAARARVGGDTPESSIPDAEAPDGYPPYDPSSGMSPAEWVMGKLEWIKQND